MFSITILIFLGLQSFNFNQQKGLCINNIIIIIIIKCIFKLKKNKKINTHLSFLIMEALNLRVKYTGCAEGSIPFLFSKKIFCTLPFV